MRRAKALAVAGLAAVALLCAGVAAAIYMISAAHLHGLASTDRRAIQILAGIAVVSATASVWVALRRA
jgi:hypothetical protein